MRRAAFANRATGVVFRRRNAVDCRAPLFFKVFAMTQKEVFLQQFPTAYFLAADDLDELSHYLQQRGWLAADETVQHAEKAGEGNMNCTLRVRTARRSLILKQARPWVEKYPTIAAPPERALVEGRFYKVVQTQPDVVALLPKLIGVDETSHLLALEDLGAARDFMSLYRGETLTREQLSALVSWLVKLHDWFVHYSSAKATLTNRAMRELNHLHIFDFPLRPDNGLDLDAITPGLTEVARELQADERYVRIVHELGVRYLQDGVCLLHGDFFPGSWLQTEAGVRVIDPEFCFYGPPEFDVGVVLAHLHLAEQPLKLVSQLREEYDAPLDESLMWKFAAVEITRRLLGVAQLPLSYGLKEKVHMLRMARGWILA